MTAGPLKLWFIDDDLNDHLLVQRLLKRCGCKADAKFFENALRAMETLKVASRNELPNLIVCDIRMPAMSGFEFVQWLRQSPWRRIPVVMRSNSDRAVDVDAAYDSGANAFQAKSTHGEQQSVEGLFRYWGVQCALPQPA